jgi:hypothetical protein
MDGFTQRPCLDFFVRGPFRVKLGLKPDVRAEAVLPLITEMGRRVRHVRSVPNWGRDPWSAGVMRQSLLVAARSG